MNYLEKTLKRPGCKETLMTDLWEIKDELDAGANTEESLIVYPHQ